MEYGLQLYSIRDITEKDMDAALKGVAEIGYKSVEFAGFEGHSAEEIKAMLAHYGLKVSGTHTGYQKLQEDFEGQVAYHKAIGCDSIIIPSAPMMEEEFRPGFYKLCNEWIPRLKEEGIRLMYHNHAFEFNMNKAGQYIHQELIDNTDLMFEIDTYWTYVGWVDTIPYITNLKDRIGFIHLKDGDHSGHGATLGEGDAPVAEVKKCAEALGFPMIVESECLIPDGLTEVKKCFDYLATLG